MRLVCNLGRTDRTMRVPTGAFLCVAAILFPAHVVAASVLAAAGMVLAVEGIAGHWPGYRLLGRSTLTSKPTRALGIKSRESNC